MLFCADFFTYIGGRLCIVFWVAASICKLGAHLNILCELGSHLCFSACLPGRAKYPLHVRAVEKFNLLIYWFQKSGITYPTLHMNKTWPKQRLFNDKNDVFWMVFGFKIWRCDISSLEPVPHKHIGSADTPSGQSFVLANITWQGGSCTH